MHGLGWVRSPRVIEKFGDDSDDKYSADGNEC